MDSALIALIVAGVAVAGLVIVGGWRKKTVAREHAVRGAFQAFARSHAGAYSDPAFGKARRVDFMVGGQPAVLAMYAQSSGETDSSDYTRISLFVTSRAPFQARIALSPPVGGLLGGMGGLLLGPVVPLGVPDIDAAYTVRASDAAAARAVLTSPVVRAGTSANAGAELRIVLNPAGQPGSDVRVEVDQAVTDPERLETMFNLAAAVAGQLQKMGLTA